jgi:clan AA aspartic protease (TIGR02281 family)
MRTIILFIFLWACQSSIGLSQTVIQMKKDGGVSVIPCKVNGLPLSFVFDTGASEVSISMTEALFMFKNGYLSEDDIVGTQKFSDATGGISEGIVINLKEIEIAGFTLHNVSASIVKNADAPLLLGQSAISKLGTFQLDLAANTLTIIGLKNTKPVAASSSPKPNKSKSTTAKPQHAVARNNPISPIIGNSVTLGNLEIAEHDFDEPMTWDDAKEACSALGAGWRLPTKKELSELYKNKYEVGGFSAGYYWCSNVDDNGDAWVQYFGDGHQFSNDKNVAGGTVRAVRSSQIMNRKNNLTSPIIGNSITLGNLEIAEHDFDKQMTWQDAKTACAALGYGWRLPTDDELNELYKHKDAIGGFAAAYYWSSSEDSNGGAWFQAFTNGYQATSFKSYANYVRAVRAFK